MKRILFLALALLLPMLGSAQSPVQIDRATLLYNYDLDGEAADDDQVVTAANGDLTDSKTFTITAQPDVCRLIDMTVTDANSSISAGVLTIVGTSCGGQAKTCSFTFAAGGSGVKTLSCTDGQGAYFATITSITTGVLTGEGGAGVDFATIGYTSNSVNGWAMYGKLTGPGPTGEFMINPMAWFDVPFKITTSGALSTTITDVNGADDAFANVAVGDLLILQTGGQSFERKVTAKASADSITVHAAVNLPAVGVAFRYKKQYFNTNPYTVAAVGVNGYKTIIWNWSIDANANTGGVITRIECTRQGPGWPTGIWTPVGDGTFRVAGETTTASGAAQVPVTESFDLSLLPFSHCRFGLRFGTGDDADAANESINLEVTLMR